MKKIKDSYHIYAIICILLWSMTYPITRMIIGYFNSYTLGFIRVAIASCVMIVVLLIRRAPRPSLRDIPWFALCGLVGFALYALTYNTAQGIVTAATASVMIATTPVITALMARIVLREKLKMYRWAATVIEFAGVAVLTLMNGSFTLNAGILLLLLAAFVTSIYNLLQKKLTARYDGVMTAAWCIFFGALIMSFSAPKAVYQLAAAPSWVWIGLLILGGGGSAASYTLWSVAFKKAKNTSQVSNYMFITPFLASLWGFLVLGEVPDKATLIGGGIILVGVFLFNFGETLFRGRKTA